MAQEADEDIFTRGIESVDKGDTVFGLVCLEKLLGEEETPLFYSYLAVCLARENGEFNEAMTLLRRAQEEESTDPVHYLNLGRVYLTQGLKHKAIRAFRDGLLFGHDHRICNELDRIGWRNPPVIPLLPRESFANRVLGYLGARLGFR